tara:strand:- start:1255 stop:1698 length:444 start_codon:yes stop_codon:yes gene_type:complete
MPHFKKTKEWWEENWDSGLYLRNMLEDAQQHIRIIATFALQKNYTFENYDQIQFFINRNAKPAKRLIPFTLGKIKQTLSYLLETADYKIGLETIEKFILEDIQDLKQEESILELKDGEKIYETDRLNELEQTGKIKYEDNKWVEINI